MATIPNSSEPSLDIREQIARIDRMQAELQKNQAEINKWQAESIRTRLRDQAEIEKWQVDMAQTRAQAAKTEDESLKMRAETAKIVRDTRLAPWSMILATLGAASAFFAAGAAFMKLATG